MAADDIVEESVKLGKSFQIALMGLPLSRGDNLKCALVLLLTLSLQIRLQHTVLAEGWIIAAGLAGYALMRYWLLSRRYPETGEIEVDASEMRFPGSVNQQNPRAFKLAEIDAVEFFFWRGKSGDVLSSVEVRCANESVRINWLCLDLQEFEREMQRRGLPVQRRVWNPSFLLVGISIFCLVIFLLYISFASTWR